ncbi:hypothetical protein FB446DRAFT_500923 [Lentinula raphanica]|nr:hypothetical protein FB446DRAFT_500923 [Lentinula raphanica]
MAALSGTFINKTFDDRDTTDLHYAGGWPSPQDGSWNASNVGETGTLSSTEDIRANVTFIFPIPANAIYYYGIPRCCGGLYAICVDCDPNNPIFEMIDAVNTTDDGKNPPVILWSKNFDKPGIHEILLTNQNDSRFGHSQITIDRFDLQVPNSAPFSDSSSSSTVSSTTSSSSITTPALISPSVQSTSAAATPVGAIIGPVAGVCTLIGLIIGVWVFCRRRHRRIRVADDAHTQRVQMSTNSFNVSSVAPTTSNAISKGSSRYKHRRYLSSQVGGSSSSGPTSSASSHPSHQSPISPRREIDAGQVLDDFDDGETLPPDYNQIFQGAPNSLTRGLPQPPTLVGAMVPSNPPVPQSSASPHRGKP